MNDCQNAAMRDQLPDLLHDRLDASARPAVEAHVEGCVDCRAELELLRDARGILVARTPHVDTAWVVGALPRASQRPMRSTTHRRTWADWRIAAAVTVLAAGGGSMAVLHRGSASRSAVPAVTTPATTPVVASTPNSGAAAPTPMPATAVAATGDAVSGLTMTGRLEELSDDQLQALLDQVNALQAVPVTEPDPVAIQVESTNGISPEGI